MCERDPVVVSAGAASVMGASRGFWRCSNFVAQIPTPMEFCVGGHVAVLSHPVALCVAVERYRLLVLGREQSIEAHSLTCQGKRW